MESQTNSLRQKKEKTSFPLTSAKFAPDNANSRLIIRAPSIYTSLSPSLSLSRDLRRLTRGIFNDFARLEWLSSVFPVNAKVHGLDNEDPEADQECAAGFLALGGV